MNTPIGDKLFQDIPRRVAKFRENRPRDDEESVDGKKIKNNTTKIEQSSLSLSRSRATVIISCFQICDIWVNQNVCNGPDVDLDIRK